MIKPPQKKSSKRLFFALVPVLLFLILQEILSRLIFPVPQVLNFNRIDYSNVWFTSAMRENKYLSNVSFTWASDPDGYESKSTLNLYGFRDNDFSIKKMVGKSRVMFIGDSFVEGLMARDDEHIPAVFERIAGKEGVELEAMNFGVSGVGISNYFNLMKHAIPLFKPDHLILVLYANDPLIYQFEMKEPLTPLYSSRWLPRLFYVFKNMIADKTVPRSWTADPFPFIAAVPDLSNPMSNARKVKNYERFVDEKILAAMKKGRFNPHCVNEYNYYRTSLRKEMSITTLLKPLKVFAGHSSTKLHVVYLPSRSQVSDAYLRFQKDFNFNKELTSLMGDEFQGHARSIEVSARRLNIPFLDLTPILRERELGGERLFWNYDEHMKSAGYEIVARSIFDWWQENQEDED